ncbi:unnamed protein product, partial [Porites lobata]
EPIQCSDRENSGIGLSYRTLGVCLLNYFCTDPVQCSEAGDQEWNEEMERLTLSVGRTVISIYFKAAECQGGDEVELYIM